MNYRHNTDDNRNGLDAFLVIFYKKKTNDIWVLDIF